VSSLWSGALSLFVAIVAAAAYASVTNDLADREDDLIAGKRNRVGGQPRLAIAAVLAAAVGAGLVLCWLWRDDLRLVACYAATWLAFSLYSLPPLRLKRRGLPGVLCDAAGAHLFPSLAAVLLAGRGAHRGVSELWMASVGVWAFAYGSRGILWHQLTDLGNDRAAGIRTFASRHPRAASAAGAFVVFPIELGALAAVFWQIGSVWPLAALALYVLYSVHSARRWRTSAVIVAPKPRFFIVLQQFYSDLFPIALLIGGTLRDRRDLAVLIAHLLLFPGRWVHAIRRLSASTANTVVRASEPHHGGLG